MIKVYFGVNELPEGFQPIICIENPRERGSIVFEANGYFDTMEQAKQCVGEVCEILTNVQGRRKVEHCEEGNLSGPGFARVEKV